MKSFVKSGLGVVAALVVLTPAVPALSGCSRDNIDAVNLSIEGDKVKSTNPEEAISKYEQASKLDPSNHRILGKLGRAYRKKEDWQKAAATYAAAEKLAPTFADYYYEHGYALEQQAVKGPTSWAEAKQPLMDAISKDPNMAEAYEELGDVEYHLDDEQGALQNFTKAIELRPDESAFYATLASLYRELGYTDEEEKVLKTGLTFIKPGDKHLFAVHTLLGDVYDTKNNKNAALTEYDLAKKACDPTKCSEPGQQIAFFNLGVAYAQAEPPRKAEAMAQLANFQKVICKGAAAARYADQCSTAQQMATKLGGSLQ
jgi:tetratricopeptide (TPR) repeat protein